MKVSLDHIRYYKDQYNWSDDPAPKGIEYLVQKIGAQLGAVEEVTPLGDRYSGVLVAKVVSCVDHPNADRLHVCMVDDGGVAQYVERDEQGLVQVVCGAPNVREGISVAWLPPGSTVPSTFDGDPFVLEARELRGVVSNGMLASPKELAIGDAHEGILEVDDPGIAPGTPFAEAYGLKDDYIIDMENKMFTHRPDCFGMLGIAREIAGIQQQQFTSPGWYRHDFKLESSEGPLLVEVKNELPELVPRFVVIPMSDVHVKPSPVWLQSRLSRIGIRPINNIVDFTNYFMILTGQPLHAYDYDKVLAQDVNADHATIVIRHPREGEKILLLNGKEIEPRGEAIMIATNDRLIGVGGVMGGGDTEVDENTKNIIIECANFDMYSVRRTSMAHGLFTDAVSRFNKGQSPLQNVAVLAKIVDDLQNVVGARIAGPLVDDNHLSSEVVDSGSIHAAVTVSRNFINARLGFDLSADEIAALLRNVEFSVDANGDDLTVKAPFWRTDIAIPEDIVEEVGRLYGFDHLPLELPKRNLTPVQKDPLLELKTNVRGVLSKAGANEVLSYSFVHGNLIDKVGQQREAAFRLSNALSPDLQYYRLTLTPSLLEKIHPNIKAGFDEFALFEVNKSHIKGHEDTEGLPEEMEMLAFVYAANDKKSQGKIGSPYFQAKKYLEYLANSFGVELTFTPLTEDTDYPVTKPFDYKRSAIAGVKDTDITLGIVGEYRQAVHKNLKLPRYVAGFEIGLQQLLEVAGQGYRYEALPRFPKLEQDISLRVASTNTYQDLASFVESTISAHAPERTRFTLKPIDIYQPEGGTAYKHITFRLSIASYDRTLTDDEVNRILDEVANHAKESLSAERI